MKIPNTDGYILVYDFLNEPPRIFPPLFLFIIAIIGAFFVRSALKNNSSEKDIFGITDSTKFFLLAF